jgi:hypothetical protein
MSKPVWTRASTIACLATCLAACLLTTACMSTGDGAAPGGTGGSRGAGGAMNDGSGGATAAGTGGATATGTGGAVGAGGRTGTGGAMGAGGRTGTGGATAGTGGARVGTGGALGASDGGAACPAAGGITYTLARAATPTAAETAAYDRIVPAMDTAVAYYNCYTNIVKSLSVTYVPTVQTADGNVNGSIRFGSTDSMNFVTAMHEISHTVGVGSTQFDALVTGGVFTGATATAQMRAITGVQTDIVNADNQHFWPYGLNYTTEYMSMSDLLNHCKMVIAIRKDIGF